MHGIRYNNVMNNVEHRSVFALTIDVPYVALAATLWVPELWLNKIKKMSVLQREPGCEQCYKT